LRGDHRTLSPEAIEREGARARGRRTRPAKAERGWHPTPARGSAPDLGDPGHSGLSRTARGIDVCRVALRREAPRLPIIMLNPRGWV